jgi:hypothetical protein
MPATSQPPISFVSAGSSRRTIRLSPTAAKISHGAMARVNQLAIDTSRLSGASCPCCIVSPGNTKLFQSSSSSAPWAAK